MSTLVNPEHRAARSQSRPFAETAVRRLPRHAFVACRSDVLRRRIESLLARAGVAAHPADALAGQPGGAGGLFVVDLETAARLEAETATRVVVVAAGEEGETPRLIATGAAAVVPEQRLEDALLPSVEAALAGQVVVPAADRRRVSRPTLTAREKQALALVVMGFSNAEIAGKLHLTVSTVKSHLRSAFRKLGVRSRNEATALILDPANNLGLGILELSGDRVIV